LVEPGDGVLQAIGHERPGADQAGITLCGLCFLIQFEFQFSFRFCFAARMSTLLGGGYGLKAGEQRKTKAEAEAEFQGEA